MEIIQLDNIPVSNHDSHVFDSVTFSSFPTEPWRRVSRSHSTAGERRSAAVMPARTAGRLQSEGLPSLLRVIGANRGKAAATAAAAAALYTLW